MRRVVARGRCIYLPVMAMRPSNSTLGPDPATTCTSVLLVLVVGALVGACAPPDRPPRMSGNLPAPLLEALGPDTVRTTSVAPGVHHHYMWAPGGPFAIHLLEVDRGVCDLGLEVGVPPEAAAGEGGFARVSAMAAGHPRRVVAAVNGDFFSAEGLPSGAEAGPLGIRGGIGGGTREDIRGGTERVGGGAALVVRDRREPWIGPASVDPLTGAVSGPGWRVDPDDPREVQVIGGLPELLDDGDRVGDLEVSARAAFAAGRHPRTAVGFDDARLWIVAIDGRREGYSAGMTLPELTGVLEALGVREAINLDGGGSTVLVVDHRVVSRPSDPTGEREVANSLLIVSDPALCR